MLLGHTKEANCGSVMGLQNSFSCDLWADCQEIATIDIMGAGGGGQEAMVIFSKGSRQLAKSSLTSHSDSGLTGTVASKGIFGRKDFMSLTTDLSLTLYYLHQRDQTLQCVIQTDTPLVLSLLHSKRTLRPIPMSLLCPSATLWHSCPHVIPSFHQNPTHASGPGEVCCALGSLLPLLYHFTKA